MGGTKNNETLLISENMKRYADYLRNEVILNDQRLPLPVTLLVYWSFTTSRDSVCLW